MADGYIAVNLRRHDDAGIAKITVTDETDSIELVFEQYVDLYHADFDDTNGEYETFLYQVALPDLTHSYSIEVLHSGEHNVNAVGPDYTVEFGNPYRTDKLNSAEIEVKAHFTHSNFPSYINTVILESDVTASLEKYQTFTSNGSDTAFSMALENYRAAEITAIGHKATSDSTVTWYDPGHFDFTWGSNDPDYDNNTINSNGWITVNWLIAPDAGNVYIKFIPIADSCYLETILKQPNDGISYIDNNSETRLLDHCFEIID